MDDIFFLEEESNGVCMICGQAETAKHPGNSSAIKRLALDHDHNTNRLRGFLCSKCNVAIERFDSIPDFHVMAISYIMNANQRQLPSEKES